MEPASTMGPDMSSSCTHVLEYLFLEGDIKSALINGVSALPKEAEESLFVSLFTKMQKKKKDIISSSNSQSVGHLRPSGNTDICISVYNSSKIIVME
jgi:hypothetical protein